MKTVLITGATSGIGKQLAIDYALNGYQVIACGRNNDVLNELTQSNENLSALNFDITDKLAVKEAANTITSVDLVILNAGNCEYIDDAKHFDGALFERVIYTNLVSIGYCLQNFLPKISQGGQIALMSSSVVYLPLSRAEAYGASKAGVTYLGQSLAIDLAPKDISVSVIHPGFVKTPLTDKNNFPMPFAIDVSKASSVIRKGMEQRRLEIHFPKRFTLILKLLRLLLSLIHI